jgi:hypothetical protein
MAGTRWHQKFVRHSARDAGTPDASRRPVNLLPCPGCERHIDHAEVSCPFCGHALSPSFRCPPGSCAKAPAGRLGRAALAAMRAAAVAGTVTLHACSQPLYGGPPGDLDSGLPPGDAGRDGGDAATADAGGDDAGDSDAGGTDAATNDGGADDGGGAMPLYGGPPP